MDRSGCLDKIRKSNAAEHDIQKETFNAALKIAIKIKKAQDLKILRFLLYNYNGVLSLFIYIISRVFFRLQR